MTIYTYIYICIVRDNCTFNEIEAIATTDDTDTIDDPAAIRITPAGLNNTEADTTVANETGQGNQSSTSIAAESIADASSIASAAAVNEVAVTNDNDANVMTNPSVNLFGASCSSGVVGILLVIYNFSCVSY